MHDILQHDDVPIIFIVIKGGSGSIFNAMKTFYASIVAMSFLLAGCPLPIPHQRALTPIFHGTVVDAETNLPIGDATIEVVGGYLNGQITGKTDRLGTYKLGVTEKATWYVILPPAAEGSCSGTITFSHPNYEKKSFQKGWFGSSVFDGPCGRCWMFS